MRRRTLGRREEVGKEEAWDRREEVEMVRHMQAVSGAGLRSLYKLETRGPSFSSLMQSWLMTLCFPALTLGQFEWSLAIFERGLNSTTAAYQRALVSVENRSPLCILVFLTPWKSSTLARLCPGVPGWLGSL